MYTVDASNLDLQETYLDKLGDNWVTQDLSQMAGTPPVHAGSPAAVVHDGFTSVFTVDANGDLWETYLPVLGGRWYSQDLSAIYHTPKVEVWTRPAAIYHDGYTSVYTVDAGNSHLQETYLPAMGGGWVTQDLSANYGAPPVESSASVVVHDGFTSVFTADLNLNGKTDLQETYLPAIGDPWTTHDLTATQGIAAPDPNSELGALYHTGFTSVYYANSNVGPAASAELSMRTADRSAS